MLAPSIRHMSALTITTLVDQLKNEIHKINVFDASKFKK